VCVCGGGVNGRVGCVGVGGEARGCGWSAARMGMVVGTLAAYW
jgi:hypothetical protein